MNTRLGRNISSLNRAKSVVLRVLPRKVTLGLLGVSRNFKFSGILQILLLIFSGDTSSVSPRNTKKLENIENRFAHYLGYKFAIAVSNGGTAIQLALSSFDLRKGKWVAIQDNGCHAAHQAIIAAGLTPLVIPSTDSSINMNLNVLELLLQDGIDIGCVIGTNLVGTQEDTSSIREVVGENIPILLDSCLHFAREQANLENAAVLSFGFSKPISAGEGGMILTNNSDLYSKVLKLRNWGTLPGIKHYLELDKPSWNGRPSLPSLLLAESQLDFFDYKSRKLSSIIGELSLRMPQSLHTYKGRLADKSILTRMNIYPDKKRYEIFEILLHGLDELGIKYERTSFPNFSKTILFRNLANSLEYKSLPYWYLDLLSLQDERDDELLDCISIPERYLLSFSWRLKLTKLIDSLPRN